jgi:signal transduction histidine kinase
MFAWIINRRQPALIPSLVFKNHKTLIMLPLATQTKTIGLAMVVTGLPEGAMTHERLKLLAILAKQCALIMENTLLYTALQNEHESLQKAQNRIIQAEKFAALGRMTAGAFHEFLNPLNIVSGHLQLMQMMDLPPDQVREVAALMQTQADRMAAMIKSLQRFSAPRKRTCQVLDIAPLAAQALENTRSRHPSPAVHCEINVADHCPPVNVPPGDITRILENLLDNAFEAMGEAGELRIQVETGIFKDILPEPTEMVACRLTDNGCGVPAANLPKIFDPFFTTKDVGDGTGLNLAISYALVKSMGGVLTAQSREGQGSTFTIYLPAFE